VEAFTRHVPTDTVEVGVGELAVATYPQVLVTPALGSCVGVAIYDLSARRGGLAHVMLPRPVAVASHGPAVRFATVAIPELVRLLMEAGSPRHRLRAKIAGGAAMFGSRTSGHVGERNVEEVRRQLTLMGIELVAEDTGKGHARTVELRLDTGDLLIRSYRQGQSVL
jgi:chemotaxis protein CheD